MSATWAFIEVWAHKKLDKLRKKNDLLNDIEKTAMIRGQIKFVKKLLHLPEEVRNEQTKMK